MGRDLAEWSLGEQLRIGEEFEEFCEACDDTTAKEFAILTQENFDYIDPLRPHVPTMWHPVWKQQEPVTARCVHCSLSLDPDASAWVCKSCRGVVHAYADWSCRAKHKCGGKRKEGFYLDTKV